MRHYHSILATPGHKPVKNLEQFGRYDHFVMGFYLGKEVIGSGELKRVNYTFNRKKTCLQTESVALNKKYRKKGHGIHLYRALIKHARKCGAERIYSSRHLNKFSTRMWSVKLKQFYDVKEVRTRKKCRECGCKNSRVIGYYIVLKRG